MENKFYDIPDYEGYYQINPITLQVRTVERWVNAHKGGKTLLKSKILTQSINSNGYYKVGLSKNNRLKNRPVHQILAKMFIPNPNNYPNVLHWDDNKLNNALSNLRWGTQKDNAQDSIRNGTFSFTPKGEKHHWYGRKEAPPNKGIKGIDANNNKILLDLQTGIFYYGTKDAADAFNINPNSLRGMLGGFFKNKTSLVYV